MARTAVHAPPLTENSRRSMRALWRATTPTGSLPVNVWYGTTSQRAIALASAPTPVPLADGCAVAAVKPVPGTRSTIVGAGADLSDGSADAVVVAAVAVAVPSRMATTSWSRAISASRIESMLEELDVTSVNGASLFSVRVSEPSTAACASVSELDHPAKS